MPTYEYYCHDCARSFAVIMSMTEHDKGEPPCPDCKRSNISRHYSSFYAKTSKKS